MEDYSLLELVLLQELLFWNANDVSKVQLYWSTAGFINEILSGNGLWYTNNSIKNGIAEWRYWTADAESLQVELMVQQQFYDLQGTNNSTYGGILIADSTVTCIYILELHMALNSNPWFK